MIWVESRSCGRSSKPADRSDITYDKHHAPDVLALMDCLGLPSAVVGGHSAGCFTSVIFAAENPSRCDGVLLFTPSTGINEQVMLQMLENTKRYSAYPWYEVAYAMMGMMKQMSEPGFDIKSLPAPSASTAPPPSWNFYFHTPENVDIEKIFAAPTQVDMETNVIALQTKTQSVETLKYCPKVVGPAIIISGTDDFICYHEQSQKIHLAIQNSTWVCVSEAGHFPCIEKPDQLWAGFHAAVKKLSLSP